VLTLYKWCTYKEYINKSQNNYMYGWCMAPHFNSLELEKSIYRCVPGAKSFSWYWIRTQSTFQANSWKEKGEGIHVRVVGLNEWLQGSHFRLWLSLSLFDFFLKLFLLNFFFLYHLYRSLNIIHVYPLSIYITLYSFINLIVRLLKKHK